MQSFFLQTFARFQAKRLQSPDTYGCVNFRVICTNALTGRHLLINKKDKNSRYTNINDLTFKK